MNKGKGWDNDQHRQDSKKLGDAYTQNSNMRDFKREPYDPKKEVVISSAGKITLRDRGPYLHVEISAYDGKNEGVVLRQEHTDHSKKLYKLRIQQVEELIALLEQAHRTLRERHQSFVQKRDEERQNERVNEEVRRIVGRR